MKHIDKFAFVRLIWVAVVFIVFGVGVGVVWWPQSQAIAQVRDHAKELYEEANRNDAIVRRAADLRAAQKRIHNDLQLLRGKHTLGAVTASALRLMGDVGKQMSVDIRSVAPAPASTNDPAAHMGLNATDVAIGVRGPFRNIVAFIADLPRHDVLIEVHDAQMASNDTLKKAPVLDVMIDATIYCVPASTEATNARAL